MDTSERKELLERLKKSGLLYESISLSGREIIVHEATGHTSRKIGAMSVELEGNADISNETKNALFTLYIPLVACSAGDVPEGHEEFFWMKNDDIETWLVAARKLNPKLFTLLDIQEERLGQLLTEEELAKKKPKRSRSSKR